jgi:hypothetical protein
VTRRIPVRVQDQSGKAVAGAEVRLQRKGKQVSAVTNAEGWAVVELQFTDKDLAWSLAVGEGHPQMQVNFFTSTPLFVQPH